MIVVIGAGMGGLAAAIDLARDQHVLLLEMADACGGKMRTVVAGGAPVDAGPTVLTMADVFRSLFEEAGETLEACVELIPARVLARHGWTDGSRLDLLADRGEAADAIGVFAGAASARAYQAFCGRAARVCAALDGPFMRSARPSMAGLVRAAGVPAMLKIGAFETLWGALGGIFEDDRLRQLFARYATYTGSSPLLAPATLMLIAHVEQEGVWLVRGGMIRLAEAMAALAARLGARVRTGIAVSRILVEGGRAVGVETAQGERIAADAVICAADAAALAAGRFGAEAARVVPALKRGERSLSAITWAMAARPEGFPLARHSVFFARDYAREFETLWRDRAVPEAPTVYLCAQDRDDAGGGAAAGQDERVLCLINAPPDGDARGWNEAEVAACLERTTVLLARCGVVLNPRAAVATAPDGFDRLFPATGGALYGQATHGATASFRRPGAVTRLRGLFLAGGSAHPGAGVPMAALSGRLAAAAVRAFLQAPDSRPSTGRSARTATPGGTSMR